MLLSIVLGRTETFLYDEDYEADLALKSKENRLTDVFNTHIHCDRLLHINGKTSETNIAEKLHQQSIPNSVVKITIMIS